MKTIVVVDYDPGWPSQFEALRSVLLGAVEDLALSIEHVGSTSVPGLAAKPVIDIDVVVPAKGVASAIDRLTAIGYEHLGDLGIPEREALKRPKASAAHNLYVCPQNSQALANHLAVRAYLRGHADAARRYGELKKRLACDYSDDIDGYVEGKSKFLLGILGEMGFAPAALADIERMNRKRQR